MSLLTFIYSSFSYLCHNIQLKTSSGITNFIRKIYMESCIKSDMRHLLLWRLLYAIRQTHVLFPIEIHTRKLQYIQTHLFVFRICSKLMFQLLFLASRGNMKLRCTSSPTNNLATRFNKFYQFLSNLFFFFFVLFHIPKIRYVTDELNDSVI